MYLGVHESRCKKKSKFWLNGFGLLVIYVIENNCAIAQFKLDICMRVAQEICKIPVSSTQAMYPLITLHVYSTQAKHEYSLSSHVPPSENPAHAQYTKYKLPDHSNHEQRTFLIQPQQQSIGSQRWCLLLVMNVHHSKCKPHHKLK